MPLDDTLLAAEWLEADGRGGFASGTVSGERTRRYHALLLTARTPPTGRMVLVNGYEVWLETAAGRFPLSTQRYHPDVVHPQGQLRLEQYRPEPWPSWSWALEDGSVVGHELFAVHGSGEVALRWWRIAGTGPARLLVRLLLSGRDYHSLHHENDVFRFEPDHDAACLVYRPYPDVPPVVVLSNGDYRHEPLWFRNFLYRAERDRGLEDCEDLVSPGELTWDLSENDAVCILAATTAPGAKEKSAEACYARLRRQELERRQGFASPLERAADAYIVTRSAGRTVLAGYPWFTDWGRDTFIAMRGLCLSTGRIDDARQMLLQWAEFISDGMLPNRFPDGGETPEYNSVDASLWYVIAVGDTLALAGERMAASDRRGLQEAVEAILSGYSRGTRFGIRATSDGLLAAGEPGTQLTWMDARIGDWTVTPRVGKPVEIQALWLNALQLASRFSDRWQTMLARGRTTFADRFWNGERGCLYDVVDVDHVEGQTDATLRPNQVLAVGGLPLNLLDGERARQVIDVAEARLWTPLGLRSLAPGEPGYAPRYFGSPRDRDSIYHQGPVWPWLAGPFIEGWLRVHAREPHAARRAREQFLVPLERHLEQAGLGRISEIADAEPPHKPGGCPFQAWSLGEYLRVRRLLAEAEGAA